MNYPCELKQQPEQAVVSIRTHTPVQALPDTLGQAFDALERYLGGAGAAPAGAPFVAYYNMDMSNLDVEIGFPVTHALPGADEVQPGVIPAGMVGSCLYTGPYQEMAPAYDELNGFVDALGYQPAGTVYEFYLNEPGKTPPALLQTQIVFLLKPKA